MSERVDIDVELHGTEQVNAGFASIGNSTKNMSTELRSTARDIAVFGAATMGVAHLAETFGILNKEQARALQTMGSIVAIGATMVRLYEAIATASWAATIAENARGLATSIANAVANPLFLPVILAAGAAAAAGIGALAPKRHSGGPIQTSGLYNLQAGEHVLTQNQYQNMGGVSINVYGGSTDNVMEALRRVGIK